MKIYITSDHAGYKLKELLKKYMEKKKRDKVIDKGPENEESVDYPDFAKKVALAVSESKNNTRGILICGTGIGMSIAANKFSKIRAALCHDIFTAKMSRKHNDSNVLVLGSKIIKPKVTKEVLDIWLETSFEEGKHKKRLIKIEKSNKN